MIQPNFRIKMTFPRSYPWASVFLALWVIGGCGSSPHTPQNDPLAPPENASSLAAQLLLYGNRLFAKHRWTAAIGKFEGANQAQPILAEAHYNLGMALYKKGHVSTASPHFIEADVLAPGHLVI